MKNTYSASGFIFTNIYGYFIAWFWYKALLFRSIEGLSFAKSMLLLLLLLIVSLAVGYSTQKKTRMNTVSIAMNIVTGYGLYTLVSYFPILKSLILSIVALLSVLVGLYATYLITYRREGVSAYKMIPKRVFTFVRGSQAFLALGMAILMLVPCVSVTVMSGVSQAKSTIPSVSQEATIANNIDCLSRLDNSEWFSLTFEEKLDVLQTIVNIECRYLGLPHELNVVATDMERDTILGNYSDRSHTISVSVKSLMYDAPCEVVDTVCHEAYHAYQHCLVDMYNSCDDQYRDLKVYRRVKKYEVEFGDYITGTEDFCGYYEQACEEDAREYAASAVEDYYNKIHEYINESN